MNNVHQRNLKQKIRANDKRLWNTDRNNFREFRKIFNACTITQTHNNKKYYLQFHRDEDPGCLFGWEKLPEGNKAAAECRAPIPEPEVIISAFPLRATVYCDLG